MQFQMNVSNEETFQKRKHCGKNNRITKIKPEPQ